MSLSESLATAKAAEPSLAGGDVGERGRALVGGGGGELERLRLGAAPLTVLLTASWNSPEACSYLLSKRAAWESCVAVE